MTYCRFYIFFSKLSLACFLDFIMLTFTSVCIQDILYVPHAFISQILHKVFCEIYEGGSLLKDIT